MSVNSRLQIFSSSLIPHPSSLLFGLDALPLTETRTGVGHYTFELARALALLAPAHEFELDYPSSYPPFRLQNENEPPLPPNLRAARISVGFIRKHWWSIGLPAYIRRRRLSLFHGTNYDVPLWKPCPTVLTIHDLSLLLHPATHEARRVRRARRRLPLMARAATMIITPTESVRREVCEHLRVSPSKVVAVAEAPRRIFRPLSRAETGETRARLNVEGDFLLAVGTVEPRKNLLTLVRAFDELLRHAPALSRLQLVIAGATGWLTDELHARVSASPARGQIHFTGYLSERDLCALYSSCLAFVYPSLYEGFGLPPLEAAACAAPVICGDIPALRESLGDTARLFPPTHADALTRAILDLIDNPDERARLASAGQQRASQFTWERTARLTLDVYEEALRGAAKQP
ncbi:MAG TPA: glycosyltransferase family 1 protein [Pyrinomonadaceae bacterium]|nr:glycosyltransferase family 1 protein [Pyrinomonadaceae bacterium]